MSFFDEIRDQIGAAPEGAPSAPTPDAAPAAPRSASPSVGEFVAQVAPAAIEAGRRLGVDPSILIGQWGLETGWGKSVIPGTNNLGNIKDFSGSGIAATDNMTGSRDRYRQYTSINDFGSDYADLIERRYGSAIGAGQDAARYAEALKAGGYAEDPAYVEKMARAAEMVRGAGVGLGEGWNGAPAGATQQGGAVSLEPDSFLASGFEALEQRDRQEAADESPISTSFGRGIEGLKHNAGLMVDNALGDSESIAERIRYKREWDRMNPAPSSSQAFMADFDALDDDSLAGVLGAALRNPTGALNQMVEQTPNSLPGLALQVPVMIASGALTATGWGAPLGIALQGAAAFIGNVLPEGGAFIEEELSKSGIDPNNVEAVAQWAAENRDRLLQGGATKAGVISFVDGVTGYLGAKLVAGPSAKFAAQDRQFIRAAGINPADKTAAAAVRATPAYKQALSAPAAELIAATTGAQKVGRALGSLGLESFGEGAGEYAGTYAATGEASMKEAGLEAMMGFGTSAAMTGAQSAMGAIKGPDASRKEIEALAAYKPPVMQPNSPLTNAANMATASTPAAPGAAPGAPAATAAGTTAGLGQPEAAAPGTPGAEPGTDLVATDALSDDAARLQRIQSFAEDKAFLSALRSNPAYGKESASDFLSAYAKARNPNIDPLVRARAMDDIESFIRDFENRPNFTMGGAQAERGGDQQQAGAPDLFGAATPQLEAPAFAERDITPRAPTPELETDQILQARRTADAEYDQAFQDLVKAEQLGASDADLMEYQQALEDAKKQRAELDAELEAVQRRIESGRKQQTAEKRRAILDDILADPETANPAARFTAELQRQGFTQIVPDSDEMATIQRFEDAREAMATLPAEKETVQPATPAQAAKPVQTDGNARQDGNAKPRLTVDQVKQAVTAGASLDGNVLRAPGASPIALQGPTLAAAREAVRRREAGPALKPVAQGVRNAVESGGLAQQIPRQGGITNNVPTAESVAQEKEEAGGQEGAATGEGTGIGAVAEAAADTEAAPFFVLAPTRNDERVEMPVWSMDEARQKVREYIKRTEMTADQFGAGVQVFDAKTGQPAARVNFDGEVVPTETMEQARARSEEAVAQQGSTSDAPRITRDTPINDGETVVDAQGNPYRVHYQRNDLVVAHPIVDGKPQVSADTTVRFWTNPNVPPSGDEDRTDPIFVQQQPTQAPTAPEQSRPEPGRRSEPAQPDTDAAVREAAFVEAAALVGRTPEEARAAHEKFAAELGIEEADRILFANLEKYRARAGDSSPQDVAPRADGDLREDIARAYIRGRHERYGHSLGEPTSNDYAFADDIINKNVYALEHLANGMNDVAKAVFEQFTGVKLPKQQGKTWSAMLEWAGVTPEQDAVRKAEHRVGIEERSIEGQFDNTEVARKWAADRVADGYDTIEKNAAGETWLMRADGTGFNLSKRGTRLNKLQPLLRAHINLKAARKALEDAERSTNTATKEESTDAGTGQEDGQEWSSAALRAPEGEGIGRPAGPWSLEDLNEDPALYRSAGEYLDARASDGTILVKAIDATLADRDAALGLALPGMDRPALPADLVVAFIEDAPIEGDLKPSEFDPKYTLRYAGHTLDLEIVELEPGDVVLGLPPLVLHEGYDRRDGEEFAPLSAYRVPGVDGLFDFVDAVEQGYAILAQRAGQSPAGAEMDADIAEQFADAAEPTDGQKDAGNYQMAHIRIDGMDVSIETEKGARRTGADANGTAWAVTMPSSYGYIRGTKGADKDHVDIFVGPNPDNGTYYVINQNKPNTYGTKKRFDEHKVAVGFASENEAVANYLLSFADDFGARVFGSVAGPYTADEFKALIPQLEKASPIEKKERKAKPLTLATPEQEAERFQLVNWLAYVKALAQPKRTDEQRARARKIADAEKRLAKLPPSQYSDEAMGEWPNDKFEQFKARAEINREMVDTEVREKDSPDAVFDHFKRALPPGGLDSLPFSREYVLHAFQKKAEAGAVRTRRIKVDDMPAVEVTLPSGNVYRMNRLTGAESMGLAGWHDMDRDRHSFLGDNQEQAIAALLEREAGQQARAAEDPKAPGAKESDTSEQWVTPKRLELPTVEFDGDTWYILSTGDRRDDGKVFAHLASATRGRQQKNGVNPVQVQDYIDLPAAQTATIPEPKNWRTSYGAAQKYAEAMGVNPRGEDGKYLKLPALVAAIEAKRGAGSSSTQVDASVSSGDVFLDKETGGVLRVADVRGDLIEGIGQSGVLQTWGLKSHQDAILAGRYVRQKDVSLTNEGKTEVAEKPSRKWPNEGAHFHSGASAFGDGLPRVLPAYFKADAGKNAKDWYRGWDAANLASDPTQSAPREVDSESARKSEFPLSGGADAKIIETARHGEFLVYVAGESYGSFKLGDSGKVFGVKARAGWAEPYVREAANTFAAMQRGETTNVADAAPVADSGAAKFDKLINAARERVDLLKSNREKAKATGNEWTWDAKVVEAEATLRQYEEARAKFVGESMSSPRPQLGDDGYTLEHAQEDLAALRAKADAQGVVADARLLEKIRAFEQVVEDLRWNGAEPDYRAGHTFTADGGEQWVIQKNVRPGDDTITVVRTKDGRPYTYGRSFVEGEMRRGQDWLFEQEQIAERAKKDRATERKTAEPKSLDELRSALDAGDKAHFDYAGAHGRTLWIDDMGEGKGWALHSKEDDSPVVIRSGGDPRAGGYSKDEAIARALADAQYRFTEWKPVAEQQGAIDQILTDKVKTLTDRGVEQSQINQAVAEYKDGDATLIDDLLRISAPEAPADTAPAATDDDLDAMFDEILAEELAAKPKREKKARAPKAGKPTREMTAAEKARRERLEYAKESAPRGAGAAAKSAAKNTAAGLADAIAGLGKLFGGNGRLSSGLTFDEETYEKAKPLFKSAIAHFKDAKNDLKAVMREIVRMVVEQFGPHVAGNMKPYATRFVADVRDGKIDYDEGVADTSGEKDERGSTGGAGDSSLDGAPAAKDGGPEGSGDAGDAGETGGGARDDGDRRDDAEGRGSDDGRGDGAAGVHHPAAGGVAPSNAPATNFVITDDVRLGHGGEVQKFNDNLAAIRIVKQLEAERRRATPDEQRQLARYVGWGGLPSAFRNRETGLAKDGWEKRVLELEALLTRKELESARSTTTDAHYTSQAIVRGMWAIAQRLGFKGGAVLEPSMGTGNFFGLVPEALRGDTRFIGIEYDSLTARIAKALYPQASVLQSGFERVPLPSDQFDLAIGNPPFGKTSLYFPTSPELNGLTIHNQFFLGSMDAVRAGGLQIMVVSRYLMDAKDSDTRRRLAEEAELVAAIRLPDSAFAENARTEVVTDVIVLRKLTEQERADRAAAREDQVYVEPDWIQSAPMPDPLGGDPMEINRYFHRNPSMVLGTLERSGSMRYGADVTVRPDPGVDLEAALTAIAGRLPAGAMTPSTTPAERSVKMFEAMRESLELVIGGHEEGNIFFNDDGKLTQVMLTEGPGDRDYLTRRTIDASSPWHSSLMMDADGAWFRLVQKLDENGEKVKNGRFNVYEREVFARPQDVPEELRLGEKAFERLTELAKLRDRLRDQLVLETNDEPGAALEENRKRLREDYARFVKAFGFVGSTANQRLLDTMPDGPLVTALESDYDAGVTAARARTTGLTARKPSANPAPIMSKRVVVPFVAPARAESSRDAMTISLAETGRIDLERMAKLVGKTQQEVIDDLHTSVDDPLIFKDPETGVWEVRDAYLSGLVVRKLNAARDAGLEKNIVALESVQPPPIQASDIGVQLGATWVPPDVYAQFLEHLTKAPASVRFSRKLTTFDVRADSTTPEARMRWGTERAGVDDLVASMLNSRSIAVYNYYTDEHGNQRRELDREETELAVAKAEEVKNEFADWIMGDANRRRRLAEIYNEQFNNRVIRQYDGANLVLPGKVPDAIVELRRHQKNAIWRGVSERFILIDHAVGAGKTYTAIARAMERRRMGLSKKPMIVVPNHMVEQFASDVYRLYPGARILALGQKDLEAKRRRRAFARIATGDWDIVIVPHSSFGFIGISQEREQDYLQQEIAEIEEALREARAEAADEGGRFRPQSVKTAEATLKGLQQRMAKITDKKRDKLLTFEQMGIDDLTIDEAHEFKNLMYHTRLQRVLGLGNQQGSKKAYDLYMKVRTLRDSPRGSVVFMTGTPISNSVVEMYTMMRYLAADALEDYGIDNFDAWHKQFAEAVTRFEQNEAGLLSEKTRLSRWANMPELMKLYYSFTDAVSLDDIKTWYKQDKGHDFPVPKVKGGKRRNVVVQPTPAQVEILDDVVSGFNGLEDIKDPRERNAERLRLMDRARKVALDARAAVRGLVSDERGGKLEVASDEIARIYHEWTPDKGAQLVFLDRSTKKSNGDQKVIDAYDKLRAEMDVATAAGDQDAIMEVAEKLEKYNADEIAELREAQKGGWTAYDQIKRNLIERGIPENQIRFIQEANTDEQKQQLFDMVKSGEVRVLIGSTPKMGAGTNVQDRLVALHHIDVNWKPSDIEQREGRIIRQGNLLLKKYGDEFEVEIIAYATERTYDGKMWALNEAKGRFIHGLRAYSGEREVEIDDSESENMAEMAALASGNPLMLERVQLDAEVKKLEVQRRAHNRRQSAVDDALADARRIIETYPDVIERAKVDDRAVATAIEEAEQEMASRTVEIEGETFGGYIDAERAALAMIAEQRGDKVRGKFVIHVGDKPVTSLEGLQSALRDALGDAEPLPLKLEDGKTFKRINNAGVEITQIINAAAVDGENEVTIGLAKGIPFKAYIERGEGGELLATLFAQGDYVREAVEIKAGGDSEISSGASKAFSPRATIVAISRLLRDIGRGREAKRLQSALEMARGDLAELEAQTGKAWPKADEYATKVARLKDVVTTLSSDTAGHAPAAEDADTDPSVLRATPGAGVDFEPVSLEVAAGVVAGIRPTAEEVWKVELRLVPSFDALPQEAKDEIARDYGPDERPKGLLSGDVVYVIADQHDSASDVEATILHEIKGHVGVRRFYGADITREINKLFLQIGGARGLKQLADERSIDLGDYAAALATSKHSDDVRVRIMMEELLAHLAEAPRFMDRVKAIVGQLRAWLRKMGWVELPKMGQTDLLWILKQADRKLGEPGPDGGPRGGKTPAVKRNGTEAKGTESAAFKKWFGNSKVVDAEGRPLVVYHGTKSDSDFSEFNTPAHFGSVHQANAVAGALFRFGAPPAAWGESPRLMPVYLSIKDPVYIADTGAQHGPVDYLDAVYEAGTISFGEREEILYDENSDQREDGDVQRLLIERLEDLGYDGFIYDNKMEGEGVSYAPFRPEQIKSATGNSGNYDPAEPSIVLRKGGNAMAGRARNKIADLFSGKSAKTFNWWQRTVGSQYGKARADADFGRVYEKAHDFIDDVSEFARSASDKAMGILPHMDTVGDVVKGLNARRAWSDAKDYQAISDAIFSGTLEDKVWNAGELRARFGLDDKQAALYKQFRDATDFSLETLASSEMARAARAEGMETADPRMSMAEAEAFYVGQVEPLVTAAREVIEGLRLKHRIELEDAAGQSEAKRDALIARQARERMAAEGALAKVAKLRDSFTEKAEQIRALQGKGYAPLMRFGQYTVDVVRLDEDGKPAKDDDGEIDRPFFGMFESEAEAREAEKIMRDEYPGYTVSRGVASTESSELYQGMSPEAAEMFARLLGVDVNDAFQTYLRQALNNRSAMKRLIKRKGMAGFANDIPRVLASFIASNARLASSNWHFGEMRKAAAAIPKHKGDVTDEAIKLMNYIQNPQEEAAAMRGFLFFNFLGGSLASAIVNTTQTFSTTLPYLNQFGAAKAAKAIGNAMALGGKAMARGLDVVKDKDLHAALKRAAEDGIIDPQEIHLLMAEARGSGASNVLGTAAGLINESWRTPAARVGRAAMGAWGSFFSMAEKYNRHVAFIAAWDVAQDMTAADFKRIGVADRFEFARRAVIETQFDYSKVSRPNWARGAIGATLFTFKTFLVNWIEFVSRLPSRERALALAVLFLMSGLSGAPGTDDLDDLVDTIGQKLGYNWNNESGRHAWLVDVLGKDGANFVEHGVSAFIPLDVSARLGMGNLIPGTGLLKDSTTTPSREIAEIFGPAGSVFMGAVDAFGNVGSGKGPLETLRPIMPKAINDFRQAYDIATSGEYRDYRGRKVVDADLGDAFIKAIGFHPNVVAEPKRVERMVQQSVALHRTRRAEINELWARGVVEKDAGKVESAREMLRDWNRKNPTAPIRMNPESVKARVKAMRSTSAERLVKASSKDMRGMVANEIAVKD